MIPLSDDFLTRPIAHRALHDVSDGRPENSRAAIQAAVEAGYGIEIDLQLSRDGAAMVFHDYDLSRLTGQAGFAQQFDAADLGQITLIGNGEGIPTLPEVLDLVAGRVPLLIELKDQHGQMGETDGRLEQAVAFALKGYDGPAALMSFNPNMMARLADLQTGRPLGLVTSAYTEQDFPELPAETRAHLAAILDLERTHSSFISHEAADLSRGRVVEVRASGVPVLCWTIRSPEAEAEARRYADNVTFEGYTAAFPA